MFRTRHRNAGAAAILTTVLCAIGIHSADFTPPDKDQALQAIKQMVVAVAKSGKNVDVWLSITGTAQKLPLASADDKAVGVKIDASNVFMQPWEKISAEQIAGMAKVCVQEDAKRALALADYCIATGQQERADQALALAAQLDRNLGAEFTERAKVVKSMSGAAPASATNSGSGPAPALSSPPPTANSSRAAAIAELSDFSLAGMDRRLGPDYAFYHKSQKEKFPDIWLAPRKEGAKGHWYEIGGPWTKEAGDYSSTQGQILYVPDSGFGVDRVTILEMSNNCFSERPEPPWHGGFRPEPASKSWLQAAGGNPGMPVYMARGMGGWSNSGVAIFSSGLIGVAGTCTARGSEPTLQLPRNKIPTAISVTNKNEFALVTVCDVETMKGQVAVIALASDGKKTGFVHEWQDNYPCLVNVGVFTGMKLLGYVDLPGISTPSGICAVGDTTSARLNGSDGNQAMLRVFDLSKPEGRESFNKGNNAHFCSRSGFAVVISKHENKVAFIDLQPLFQKVHEMYFTSDENFRKTRDVGPEPRQWPYTFEADPSWKPVLVKVMEQPQPTAVLTSMEGGKSARAFVASQDGRIGIYQVGGLATEAPALPDEIKCMESVQVGRNPVCLAYQKYSQDTFIAVSRGDREIAWVKHSDKGAEVIRKLRDEKLIDPVHVEVADTHGISTSLITVSDFKGRKILNYRYSPVSGGKQHFITAGGGKFEMGPNGKDEFECGGILEFPGSPFCVSATNVN